MNISENNIKVINNEYDSATKIATGVIMSEGLQELMGFNAEEIASQETPDGHTFSIVCSDDPLISASIPATLHTFQFAEDVTVSLEIARGNAALLQTLHNAAANERKIHMTVSGNNGFSAEECTISTWALMKVAPQDYNLSVTFRSENVIF